MDLFYGKERDICLGRKREQPEIKQAYVIYNGDRKAFERFIESMILDYLNRSEDEVPKDTPDGFGGKVKVSDKFPETAGLFD